MVNRQSSIRWPKMSKRSQRHNSSVRSAHINVLQRLGTFGKLRRNLHHHVILIKLPIHDRNLPLAEGVVESVINIGSGHSQPRGGIAINDDLSF